MMRWAFILLTATSKYLQQLGLHKMRDIINWNLTLDDSFTLSHLTAFHGALMRASTCFMRHFQRRRWCAGTKKLETALNGAGEGQID
ncbi:MAG: hypothetical protein MI725_18320 [Pirellulales bacterium]|nr:hypothetical protein [Pirellulales bacterium]